LGETTEHCWNCKPNAVFGRRYRKCLRCRLVATATQVGNEGVKLMKTLLAGLSVLALTAGSAYANEPSNDDATASVRAISSPGHASTVQGAWDSSAFDTPGVVVAPDPVNPSTPDLADPTIEKKTITFRGARVKADGAQGKESASYIDQVGYKNKADSDQRSAGIGAVSDIIQVGNWNRAEVDQTTAAGSTTGDYAVITSKGNHNDAVVSQTNDGDSANVADIRQGPLDDTTAYGTPEFAIGNDASIAQVGSGNLGLIDQYDAGSKFARNNDAAISQTGQNNKGQIGQNGDRNNASISQTGTYNQADIQQTGDRNNGRVDQYGSWNTALIDQDDINNDAYVRQSGYENYAEIDQGGDLGSIDGNNVAVIDQWGTSNMASITQTDWDNSADIFQDGVSNMGSINQTGNWNAAALDQVGSWNAAQIEQTGQNYADVQQYGHYNSALVQQ